jgi:probable F420-dependent oxidoreductase
VGSHRLGGVHVGVTLRPDAGRGTTVRLGAVFPNMDLPPGREAVRDFLLGVDRIGYDHLLTYDHVVGVDAAEHKAFEGPLGLDDAIHEPLVLLSYAAALTSLELVTGILVLPQRQTALVARQVAELDLLSGGRLRLGVGLGYNELEYAAMGAHFRGRAKRMDRQIEVLRDLWVRRSIRAELDGEVFDGVGLNPVPVQRPVPLWLAGGFTPAALDRVGRLGDGWIPRGNPGPELDASLSLIARAAQRAGRDPSGIGLEGRVNVGPATIDRAVSRTLNWVTAGATHVSYNVMGCGLTAAADMLAVLAEVRSAVSVELGLSNA